MAKNRLHLCLTPDVPRDVEVERMLALGATIADDRRDDPDNGGWLVFADPEGNEFCVLGRARSPGPLEPATRVGGSDANRPRLGRR